MDFSCSCSVSIDEMTAEIYNETFPKSRKEHTCCECRETIPIGVKYNKVEGLWDGSFNTYKTCMFCYKMREKYFTHGFFFGELWCCMMERTESGG